MIDETSAGNVRVEVWMRNPAPPDGPRRDVLARLRKLEAADVVDDVTVRTWGRSIPASPEELDASDSPIHDRIAEFQQWADRNGHSLEPAFRWSEQSTMVSEERSEVIRLPLQCLAVYEDDQLVGVFPCTGDEETNTVVDCLHRLEEDEDNNEMSTR